MTHKKNVLKFKTLGSQFNFSFIVWTVKAMTYAMHKQVFSIQGEKRWILGISLRRPRRGLLT